MTRKMYHIFYDFFFSEPSDVFKTLGELKEVARPVGITFKEMITLMNQCKELEDMMFSRKHEEQLKNRTYPVSQARGILANNPFSLLSGIIPGKYKIITLHYIRHRSYTFKNYFLVSQSSINILCGWIMLPLTMMILV